MLLLVAVYVAVVPWCFALELAISARRRSRR